MVSNRVLLKSKCGLGLFSRGARRYPGILKILVQTFLQFEAFSSLASSSVVYCGPRHPNSCIVLFVQTDISEDRFQSSLSGEPIYVDNLNRLSFWRLDEFVAEQSPSQFSCQYTNVFDHFLPAHSRHDRPDRGWAARGRDEGRRESCTFTPVRTFDRRTCGHDQEAQEFGTGEAVGFLTRRVASRSRAFGEITLSIQSMEINSGVSFRHHSAARKKTFGHRISIVNMWSNMWSKTRYMRGFFLRYQYFI